MARNRAKSEEWARIAASALLVRTIHAVNVAAIGHRQKPARFRETGTGTLPQAERNRALIRHRPRLYSAAKGRDARPECLLGPHEDSKLDLSA